MLRFLVSMFLAIALLAPTHSAVAQGVEMEFGPKGGEIELPVRVVADVVQFDQRTGNAVFVGGVEVSHGPLVLNCARADVFADPATAIGIDRILLSGGVLLDSGEGIASAQTGEYDVVEGLVRMQGDVSIQFNTATMRGQSLVYDTATGKSRLSSDASIAVEGGI